MKSRFACDPLDPSGGFFDTAGSDFDGSFSPSARHVGNPPASFSVEIPSPPVLTSEAAQALSSQSGPTSTVSMTAGGVTINLLFDPAAMAAPASFRAGIQQAASLLTASISDQITVNIKIDYSGTGGGAAAGPDNGLYESYSSVRADLINHATAGDTTFNALPTGSSVQGQSNVAVWNAQLKLWGVLGANDTSTDDGSATFATDINPNLLVGVALHELTHALGRIPYGSQPDIFDMFRFTSVGTRLFSGSATAPAAYFSLDGGNTKLADYGQTSDASDFLNSGVQGSNDPFNEFYTGSTTQQLSQTDLKQLGALGFHLTGSDTQAPTLVSDGPLSILTGATQTIPSSLLSTSDNISSMAQLHYTITSAPADGTLLLNGLATLSFTQADINNGLVSYHETASGVTSDHFQFTVADAAGNVTGASSFQININSGAATPNHVIGDFSADGTSDILLYNDNGTVSMWDSGQPSGGHVVANPGAVASSSHIAGYGDFDGNGHADILWRDDNGAVFVWDNGQAAGAHTVANAGTVSSSWHVARSGDFDGNGHDDVLWYNDNGAVAVWDNGQATSGHVVANVGAVPASWHITGTGDFDGNGHSDILWYNDNGSVAIWDNGQAARGHMVADAGAVPSGWHVAGTGDFDGNGHSDILWYNDNGSVAIWDNGQAARGHMVADAGAVPSGWHVAGTGDFDGNGHSDILWYNDNGSVAIWDNGQATGGHLVANAGVVPSDWHII